MSDETVSPQIAVAHRFVKRLIALVDAGVIYPPSHQTGSYKEAVRHISGLVQAAGTSRMEEFIQSADRELYRAGLRGELLEAASSAVRGILVGAIPNAQASAHSVYQPFEFKIPYSSLV